MSAKSDSDPNEPAQNPSGDKDIPAGIPEGASGTPDPITGEINAGTSNPQENTDHKQSGFRDNITGSGLFAARPGSGGIFGSTGTGMGLDPHETEMREELLEQFFATLRVMYLTCEPDPGTDRLKTEQHQHVRRLLFHEPRTWRGAYEIEQLLTFLMTDCQVEEELSRRFAEARSLHLPYVGDLEAQLQRVCGDCTEPEGDQTGFDQCRTARRYILHRLLNDLQWFYNQRIRRREAAKRLSVRVSALFLSAFVFFFSLLFIQFFLNPEKPSVAVPPEIASGGDDAQANGESVRK